MTARHDKLETRGGVGSLCGSVWESGWPGTRLPLAMSHPRGVPRQALAPHRYADFVGHLDTVREICLALPRSYEKLSHGSPSFFIEKGRQFCSFVDGHHGDGRTAVWLPAPPGVQEALIDEDSETYFRPPYVGPSGWVGVRLDRSLSREALEALIASAHSFACR